MYLVSVSAALWDDFSPLAGHEIQELVDQEGGREGRHSPPGYRDQLTAYRTSAISEKIVNLVRLRTYPS